MPDVVFFEVTMTVRGMTMMSHKQGESEARIKKMLATRHDLDEREMSKVTIKKIHREYEVDPIYVNEPGYDPRSERTVEERDHLQIVSSKRIYPQIHSSRE